MRGAEGATLKANQQCCLQCPTSSERKVWSVFQYPLCSACSSQDSFWKQAHKFTRHCWSSSSSIWRNQWFVLLDDLTTSNREFVFRQTEIEHLNQFFHLRISAKCDLLSKPDLLSFNFSESEVDIKPRQYAWLKQMSGSYLQARFVNPRFTLQGMFLSTRPKCFPLTCLCLLACWFWCFCQCTLKLVFLLLACAC